MRGTYLGTDESTAFPAMDGRWRRQFRLRITTGIVVTTRKDRVINPLAAAVALFPEPNAAR